MLLYNIFFPIIFLCKIKFAKCRHTFSTNNNFLHLNDVSILCLKESTEYYPYEEALNKCMKDKECVYVKADEFDVYGESHGKSKMCYSTQLTGIFPIYNGRVSIKLDKLVGNSKDFYDIYLNRKGVCRSGQIVGQSDAISSYSEAARECQTLNCDYFTINFYKDNNEDNGLNQTNIIKTNSAVYCVGEPLGLHSEGSLLGERRRIK